MSWTAIEKCIRMADRITQLQDLVMQQADNLWSSIHMIDKHAQPYIFPDIVKKEPKLSRKERKMPELIGSIKKEKQTVLKEESTDKEEHIDYPMDFAKRMSGLAFDINAVIKSLPDDSMLTPDLQVESLKCLEETNSKLSLELSEQVAKAEELLKQIRESQEFLSTSYLDIYIPRITCVDL